MFLLRKCTLAKTMQKQTPIGATCKDHLCCTRCSCCVKESLKCRLGLRRLFWPREDHETLQITTVVFRVCLSVCLSVVYMQVCTCVCLDRSRRAGAQQASDTMTEGRPCGSGPQEAPRCKRCIERDDVWKQCLIPNGHECLLAKSV